MLEMGKKRLTLFGKKMFGEGDVNLLANTFICLKD
jgi:hypothetical protein